MEELIQKLKDAGCSMDETIKRFLGKKDFMIKCMGKALEDEDFDNLGKALESENAEEAFRYSHGLKGVLLNVGLDPIYDDVAVIVEKLRAGRWDESVVEDYKKLLEDRKNFAKLLKQLR